MKNFFFNHYNILILLLILSCFFAFKKNSSGDSRAEIAPFLPLIKLFKIDKQKALSELKAFSSRPHPFGTHAQKQTQKWLISQLKLRGLSPEIQHFSATVPNIKSMEKNSLAPLTIEKKGANIVQTINLSQNPQCYIAMASHYDTQYVPGLKYLGANDSGSSSILLLHLSNYLSKNRKKLQSLNCDILAIWFDGEESQLEGWNDGIRHHPAKITDNTYGSRFFVKSLKYCKTNNKFHCYSTGKQKLLPIKALVLFDMIGSPNLLITREQHSTPHLVDTLESAAKDLSLSSILSSTKLFVEDDHIPFLKKGIASINIIDFHNLEHWHKANDSISNISTSSMEKSGRLGLYTILSSIINSKAF